MSTSECVAHRSFHIILYLILKIIGNNCRNAKNAWKYLTFKIIICKITMQQFLLFHKIQSSSLNLVFYVCFEKTPNIYGAPTPVRCLFFLFTRIILEHLFWFVNHFYRTSVLFLFSFRNYYVMHNSSFNYILQIILNHWI